MAMPAGYESPVPSGKGLPATAVSAPVVELIVNADTSPLFAPSVLFATKTNCPTRTHFTTILVTLELATVPEPLVSVHISFGAGGWVSMVAAYVAPVFKPVANVKV